MKRPFSAKLLSQLTERIYELVSTSDPYQKLSVVDIENDEDVSKLEVVFGVGRSDKSTLKPEHLEKPLISNTGGSVNLFQLR